MFDHVRQRLLHHALCCDGHRFRKGRQVLADLKDDGAKARRAADYSKAGDEVWFAVWSAKEKESAIVVVDNTFEFKVVIKEDPRQIAPNWHFNDYSTQHDVGIGLRAGRRMYASELTQQACKVRHCLAIDVNHVPEKD